MELTNYIDLGGGNKVTYWMDENNLWHVKSNLTNEEHVSYEKFDNDTFFSTAKFNQWMGTAEKVV